MASGKAEDAATLHKAVADWRIVLAAREYQAVVAKVDRLVSDLCDAPYGSPEHGKLSAAFADDCNPLWSERNRTHAALVAALAPYHDDGTAVRVDGVLYIEDEETDQNGEKRATLKAVNVAAIRSLGVTPAD